MTTEDCPRCQGLGFVPKQFARSGAFKIDDKYIWLTETEECYLCKGTCKKNEYN